MTSKRGIRDTDDHLDTNVGDSIIPGNPKGESAQLHTAEDWAWGMSAECGIYAA